MDTQVLEKSPIGRLVPIIGGERAYVPNPLPRHLDLSGNLVYRLDEASRAAATLAGVGETIPNPHLLIHQFIRKEAVLSSRIEGTQASLSDLFMYEASGVRRLDVLEVVNYIKALETGLESLNHLPISVRLVNKMHAELLKGVRGGGRRLGALRSEQVWIGSEGTQIGDARFVPPPADLVRDLMLDWEKFVNEDIPTMPPLIQCALLHYQFEVIHPYLDGNGRLGRSLIMLFLCAKKILPTPLLYLSAYFERNRSLYYDQLYNLSVTGDWDDWITYFLDGVIEQAYDALQRVRGIRKLQDEYYQQLQEHRETANAFRIVQELFASPIITTPRAAKTLKISDAGARGILNRLVSIGIVKRDVGVWPNYFIAGELLNIIEQSRAPT